MGGSIGLTAAIGGILLAIVILYAVLRNQRRTEADRRRTEEATKDLYARTDRQDKATDPDPAKY
jgi:hypothetical protein